jgi:hypothetical protein
LLVTNFDDSTRWILTYSISIVLVQNLPLNSMVADTTIEPVKGAIGRENSFLRSMEFRCSGSGITKFMKNWAVFWQQFGWRSKNALQAIPHLHPLPFGKGEASLATWR